MSLLRKTVTALGLTGGGLVVGSLVAAHQISGPQRPALAYALSPFEVGAEARDVHFTAGDGVRLAGWWFESPGSDRVVVVCHGHRGSKADMLGIGPGLWRRGANVLLFDFRGNGDSEDGPQSLAHYEKLDLEAALDWVQAECPQAEIDVLGFSMGAATSIMVAAKDPRVCRVVADSPFADMSGVITAAARGLHLPPVPLVGIVDRVTGLRYGYRFAEVQPIDLVGDIAPRPLLLVHGTQDSVIPVEHTHRLAGSAGPGCQTWIVEGVDHCGAYFVDRPGYIDRIAAFLELAHR